MGFLLRHWGFNMTFCCIILSSSGKNPGSFNQLDLFFLQATTKKLNLLELKLMEARQTYSINLSRLRRSDNSGKSSEAMQSLSERGMGVGAENPLRLLDAGVLPKPDLDFLEREAVQGPDGASKSNSDDLAGDMAPPGPPLRTKLRYNPYDLLYLTDLGSESPSNCDSDDDDYLQDF